MIIIADHAFEGLSEHCSKCKRSRADILSGGGQNCNGNYTPSEQESIKREIDRIWQATMDAAQS